MHINNRWLLWGAGSGAAFASGTHAQAQPLSSNKPVLQIEIDVCLGHVSATQDASQIQAISATKAPQIPLCVLFPFYLCHRNLRVRAAPWVNSVGLSA